MNQILNKFFNFFNKIKRKSKFTKDNIKRSNVHIGEFTYGDPEIYMWTSKYSVYIGRFCSIAKNVRIIVDGNHRTDWISTYPFKALIDIGNPMIPVGGDVRIGNDVWIGMDVLILPNITIGDGAVIGAGSVVTKNVECYEIVGGNPARHIKYRFTDSQIKSLERIKWWNWPIEKIMANIQFIQSSNVDEFIKRFENK